MASSSATLQLHHRDAFERNVTRAVGAGAIAGALSFATQRIGFEVPIPFLALAGAALSCVRGDKLDRLMLMGLCVVAPAVPWLFGFSNGWTVALAGAAAGALMVKARLCEKGAEGEVASSRPSGWHYLATSVTTAGLAVAGVEVARVLLVRLRDFQAPALMGTVVAGVAVALFAGIGGIVAHLMLKADPVEARAEDVISQLSGELEVTTTRALTLYRQCGESLQALPREAAREELARALQKLLRDAIELAAEWKGVEPHLEADAQRDLEAQVADLKKSAQAAKDPVARRQLEMAASSLVEELERLGEMRLNRERIVAKLKSQVALLERARVALLGMRSGHAHIKAAEMSALARKFNALAQSQADEARLAHEVAAGAELAHQEAQSVGLRGTAEPAPVSEPAGDSSRSSDRVKE